MHPINNASITQLNKIQIILTKVLFKNLITLSVFTLSKTKVGITIPILAVINKEKNKITRNFNNIIIAFPP